MHHRHPRVTEPHIAWPNHAPHIHNHRSRVPSMLAGAERELPCSWHRDTRVQGNVEALGQLDVLEGEMRGGGDGWGRGWCRGRWGVCGSAWFKHQHDRDNGEGKAGWERQRAAHACPGSLCHLSITAAVLTAFVIGAQRCAETKAFLARSRWQHSWHSKWCVLKLTMACVLMLHSSQPPQHAELRQVVLIYRESLTYSRCPSLALRAPPSDYGYLSGIAVTAQHQPSEAKGLPFSSRCSF